MKFIEENDRQLTCVAVAIADKYFLTLSKGRSKFPYIDEFIAKQNLAAASIGELAQNIYKNLTEALDNNNKLIANNLNEKPKSHFVDDSGNVLDSIFVQHSSSGNIYIARSIDYIIDNLQSNNSSSSLTADLSELSNGFKMSIVNRFLLGTQYTEIDNKVNVKSSDFMKNLHNNHKKSKGNMPSIVEFADSIRRAKNYGQIFFSGKKQINEILDLLDRNNLSSESEVGNNFHGEQVLVHLYNNLFNEVATIPDLHNLTGVGELPSLETIDAQQLDDEKSFTREHQKIFTYCILAVAAKLSSLPSENIVSFKQAPLSDEYKGKLIAQLEKMKTAQADAIINKKYTNQFVVNPKGHTYRELESKYENFHKFNIRLIVGSNNVNHLPDEYYFEGKTDLELENIKDGVVFFDSHDKCSDCFGEGVHTTPLMVSEAVKERLASKALFFDTPVHYHGFVSMKAAQERQLNTSSVDGTIALQIACHELKVNFPKLDVKKLQQMVESEEINLTPESFGRLVDDINQKYDIFKSHTPAISPILERVASTTSLKVGM